MAIHHAVVWQRGNLRNGSVAISVPNFVFENPPVSGFEPPKIIAARLGSHKGLAWLTPEKRSVRSVFSPAVLSLGENLLESYRRCTLRVAVRFQIMFQIALRMISLGPLRTPKIVGHFQENV